MSSVTRICFVCLGNIVRSPLAENMFRHLVRQAGRADQYEISSAGTSSWHVGEPPDARMRQVAAAHGFTYTGRARQFKAGDIDRLDLIIAMDHENEADLLAMTHTPEQRARVHLLREFDPEGDRRDDVPDPYYSGLNGFERVYTMVERSCRGLLEHLEKRSGS